LPKAATKKSAPGGKRSSADLQARSGGARFAAIIAAAEQSGLLGEKRARIAGRISPELIQRAKQKTGIATDTDLIEFALASIALDDKFSETFKKTMGSVDPRLKLGF
jgi:hypothetical protein